MPNLRVAGAQLPVTEDISANVDSLLRAIDFAAREKADVLLTPEGSLSGYSHAFDCSRVEDALRAVTARAKESKIALALGTCFVEPDDKLCYNELRFYSPRGTYLGCHTKTLTCGTLTSPPQGEIAHYGVRPLRTFDLKGITVGGLICNDMWANPSCTPQPDTRLSQQLSEMGAKVIFHAVNGGRGADPWRDVMWRFHTANLQIRALAGKVFIVTVDSCNPVKWRCSTPGGVVDPKGHWVCRTKPRGIDHFACTIDLGK
jgi:predicted amidohydrolase